MQTISGPILLATDLSSRCDRALDRAVQLARQFDTSLVALHVMEPHSRMSLTARGPDAGQLAQARQRLVRDLEDSQVDVNVIVLAGDPVKRLRQIADEQDCSLIVTGVARDETLGRLLLGTTVEKLVREARQPVLVVKTRAVHPYRNAVVASDFSEGSRYALRAALALLPSSALTLFHAFDLPRSRSYETGRDESAAKGFQRMAEESAADFMDATPELQGRQQPKVQVAAGLPERVLLDYAQQSGAELLVTGTHGATGILRTSIGSVAELLLEKATCDVMVIRHGQA